MKHVLKTIIKDFHSRPLPLFKPRHLNVPLDLGKIITIIGPRRAGKTWYLFQLIASLEKAGKKFKNSRSILITGDMRVPSDMVPEWVETMTAYEWLLKTPGQTL